MQINTNKKDLRKFNEELFCILLQQVSSKKSSGSSHPCKMSLVGNKLWIKLPIKFMNVNIQNINMVLERHNLLPKITVSVLLNKKENHITNHDRQNPSPPPPPLSDLDSMKMWEITFQCKSDFSSIQNCKKERKRVQQEKANKVFFFLCV